MGKVDCIHIVMFDVIEVGDSKLNYCYWQMDYPIQYSAQLLTIKNNSHKKKYDVNQGEQVEISIFLVIFLNAIISNCTD